MEAREEQPAAFRDAVWVSRCVGRAEATPLRLENVQDLARFIRARTLAAGEPLVRRGTNRPPCASSGRAASN